MGGLLGTDIKELDMALFGNALHDRVDLEPIRGASQRLKVGCVLVSLVLSVRSSIVVVVLLVLGSSGGRIN